MTEEPDVPVDEEAGRTIAAALRCSSSAARHMVDEHQEYFDEVLSTVLLGDIGRWYRAASISSQGRIDADTVARVLDDLYRAGDDDVQTAIVTGFLEAMPHPHEEGREVVEQLPPVLRAELQKMEDWVPDAGR